MIIGWPFASSMSGRLYLRIGFRDTALCGAALIVLAAFGFLRAAVRELRVAGVARPGRCWAPGFGLLSTPLLVGVQSSVDWRERGVVTSANIFSRYLGQSIGAAIFGAIFNSTIAARLADAPSALRADLPRDINAVIGALHRRAS